jgi:DNA-binding CsgD family transcriptional regulator
LVPKSGPHHSGNILTPKEKEVLELMAKGMSSKQIANSFGLSSRTVEAHRLNIMKKLSTNNSAETIATALKLKII